MINTNDEKINNKNEKNTNKNILKYSLYALVMFLFLISLLFSNQMEYLLKLKPNLINSDFSVNFLYCSKGDCILIRTYDNKNIIIDSGDPSAKNEVLTYIDKIFFNKREKVFDYAILTHPHDDHLGNYYDIIKKYQVKNFYRPDIYAGNIEIARNNVYCNNSEYKNIISMVKDRKIPMFFHSSLPNISFQNGYLKWYTPNVEIYKGNKNNNYSEENDYSPIIIYKDMNKSFFFSGDASKNVEEEFLNKYSQENFNIDIMKLGHHGSATSTSLELLEKLNPKQVVISNGLNEYDFPAVKVVQNLVDYDLKQNTNLYQNLLQTNSFGNIIFSNFHDELLVEQIKSVHNYLYVDYYIVCIVSMGIFTFIYFVPYKTMFKKKYKKHK